MRQRVMAAAPRTRQLPPPGRNLLTLAGRRAGLMPVTSSGSTAPVLANGVLPGDRLGITVEPAGGTARPTTTPLVARHRPGLVSDRPMRILGSPRAATGG